MCKQSIVYQYCISSNNITNEYTENGYRIIEIKFSGNQEFKLICKVLKSYGCDIYDLTPHSTRGFAYIYGNEHQYHINGILHNENGFARINVHNKNWYLDSVILKQNEFNVIVTI